VAETHDVAKLLAAAASKLSSLQKQAAFDPYNLESKPTEKQQAVIDAFTSGLRQIWIRAGNQSGKSQTCARILTWVLTDTFPGWKRPDEWRNEPLLAIVAGRTGKQIEDSLLPKIRSYLEPGTFKEVRIGNIIQRIELSNGNRIIFQSLENPNVARERLQSYVAHIVWIDELPSNMEIVRELLIRVQARNGYFLSSFTPTVVNIDIQKYVDSLILPAGQVFRFHMLDNPLYADPIRRQELIDRYSHLPEHIRNAIFEGEWISADDQVYYFNWNTMVEMPPDYSPLWRHVEAIDPALKSAAGLTVWAEHPTTNIWYCILAEYIRGIYVPTDLVAAVKDKVKHFNIVRRIADPHEVWYIETARSLGIKYQGVHRKNDRKGELIKGLQQFLGSEGRIAPHCEHLISELQECRWSSAGDGRIVNASSYHLLDSSQYFVDEKPKPEKQKIVAKGWQDWLYQADQRRQVDEQKEAERKQRALQKRQRRVVKPKRARAWQ
jgi:hypothetical protein